MTPFFGCKIPTISEGILRERNKIEMLFKHWLNCTQKYFNTEASCKKGFRFGIIYNFITSMSSPGSTYSFGGHPK